MNKKLIGIGAFAVAGLTSAILLKCGRAQPVVAVEGPVIPVEISLRSAGKPVDSIASGQSGTINISVKEKSFVYLFDEYQNGVMIIGEHEGEAWEPGEYEADLPQGRDPGTHSVVAVTSRNRLTEVSKWTVIHPDAVHESCKTCSLSEAKLDVMPAQSQ
jgi:hypothetical protein